jgi:hypothetical protein
MMHMRLIKTFIMTAAICASLVSCSNHNHKAADTPAGKVGQVAYDAAKVTGKAAKAAGRELSKAAHEAHEGWKEAAAKDKSK